MINFARNRQYLVLASCTLIVLGLFIYWRPYSPNKSSIIGSSRPSTDTKLSGVQSHGEWSYPRDRDNFLLSQDQCDAAFPELFVEIERAKNERSSNPITFEEIDSIQPKNGYIRAMIYDQQVCNHSMTSAMSFSVITRC